MCDLFCSLQGNEEKDRLQIFQLICFVSNVSGDISIIDDLLRYALRIKDNDTELENYIREIAFFVELNINKMVWRVDTSVKVKFYHYILYDVIKFLRSIIMNNELWKSLIVTCILIYSICL